MSQAAAHDSRTIALPDAAATLALGQEDWATALGRGDVVCLSGSLGAGKTTLARGAIAAWTGRQEEAPSPTYTLVQTYEGAKGELWHVDLYRLKRPDDAWELGLEDAFADAACLIEWPERLEGELPHDRLDIELRPEGEGRSAALRGHRRMENPAWIDLKRSRACCRRPASPAPSVTRCPATPRRAAMSGW